MAFGPKEASRNQATPVKLFLFRGADPMLESMLKSVTLIPGSTEFGYGTTRVQAVAGDPQNFIAGQPVTDIEQSLDDLLAAAPKMRNVSLVVAWHGSDLRCGECEIRPKVEIPVKDTAPYQWRAGHLARADAQVVSQVGGRPAYGGAPSDRSIYEAIQAIKARGLRVTFYPFVMMDVAQGNALPNPYGGIGQPAYPWRGRITCAPNSANGTEAVATQVNSFFGAVSPGVFSWNADGMHVDYSTNFAKNEWRYRKFIFHMATIAAAAGVNDFLIGSEFVGLTSLRDNTGAFPAVERFRSVANGCRTILGAGVRISYAADWSEFHSVRDGGNVTFNMDPLWADSNIDFVGIDNYLPNADWRDGTTHKDWLAGFTSIHDISYLQSNIEGGEYYDWYYPGRPARNAQSRILIRDDAFGKPWVYRQKDIRNWWAHDHYDRTTGGESGTRTAWRAKMKPIVFTELGCAAVDKGPNQPNVFIDPKSTESHLPYFSNGRPDAQVMRAFLEANIRYWEKNNEPGFIEVDSITAWTWDARPYPTFPDYGSYFGDAANWQKGHWLTGRIAPGRSFESGTFGPFAFCNGEKPITRDGITYQPWPIKHTDISSTGDLDKSDITVTMAKGSGLEDEFLGFPPSQVINLTIFQGQMDDVPSLVDYPAVWLGRISSPDLKDSEVSFSCIPVSTSIKRPGLRRNYQLGCPHALYGPQCRADKNAATSTRQVTVINRNVVAFSPPLGRAEKHAGGLIEWEGEGGRREVRTIVSATSGAVTVRGQLRGLTVGAQVHLSLGCDHSMSDCKALHSNIFNFGGQPFIPLDNPLSQKNQFY